MMLLDDFPGLTLEGLSHLLEYEFTPRHILVFEEFCLRDDMGRGNEFISLKKEVGWRRRRVSLDALGGEAE
ncbi:MAG: hypothetical protein JRN42_07150 [Nitrososphaerota archaeon]|nr:hypothetical protein [Nitrososphaerota archaeon]